MIKLQWFLKASLSFTTLRTLECNCKEKTGVEQQEEDDKVETGIQRVAMRHEDKTVTFGFGCCP